MSAVAHDRERELVRLPGYSHGIGAPSVAAATDAQLRKCLETDLAAVASIADREASVGSNLNNASLTKEGLLSPEWHEAARNNRSSHANLAAVERIERRVRAIRAELPRREAARKRDVQRKADEALQRLEGVVEHAPAHALAIQAKASEVEAAWQRVQRFITDVQLVAGGVPYVEQQYSALCSGAQQAAEALGMPAPQFDPLPPLPSQADVRKLLAILSGGGRDGFDRIAPNIGDAANARELVRELNKK
jgi:hypothetical protein